MASLAGRLNIQVGVRCSMVTLAALSLIDGTMVTAVAPEPITTTFLPVYSRSRGQNCGWITVPSKSPKSKPGS